MNSGKHYKKNHASELFISATRSAGNPEKPGRTPWLARKAFRAPKVRPSSKAPSWWSISATAAPASLLPPSAASSHSASLLAPLAYTEMITSVALGWLFFSDFPDAYTFLGVAILISCAIYISMRERANGQVPAPKAQVQP